MQNTDLQNTNRPINWKAKDEIGLLVNGYNAMLEKIELGKMEISKQEKQSAWQDIARQVAHEIKNPLTPMKLNLQFLNNSIEKSEGKSKEILEKNIKNLLYNIENITEIVDSFSDYARMPLPKLVKVDLVKTLELAYLNFKNTEGIALNLNLKLKNAYVQGDEKVLFQIFNNLIINALQSVKIGSMPDIRIELKKVAQKYIFSFVDNGTGISEELQKKVFLPNFSTKKEGSGVGLSLAKWGIENMNGKIWFETEINKGTCFFIELDEA